MHWSYCSLALSQWSLVLRPKSWPWCDRYCSSLSLNFNRKIILYRDLFYCQRLGLERYAQPTIWYNTWYDAHDMTCSAIHLPFLIGVQRRVIFLACDQEHRMPPITTACTVKMHDGYNNGGIHGVSRCSKFVLNLLILLEYTGCYLWYLVFFFIFVMC